MDIKFLKPILFAAVFAAISIFFLYYPEVDILFSSNFFDPLRGFKYKDNSLVVLFDELNHPFLAVFVAYHLLQIARRVFKEGKLEYLKNLANIYILIAIVVGPLIIVNFVCKNNFGRARPFQVEQFGGSSTFTPPFVVSNQCERDCSFVSGHASVGYIFFIYAFLARSRKNCFRYTCCAIFFGGSIGFFRILQGKHFFE